MIQISCIKQHNRLLETLNLTLYIWRCYANSYNFVNFLDYMNGRYTLVNFFPSGIYLFKIDNGNIRIMREKSFKLTIKAPADAIGFVCLAQKLTNGVFWQCIKYARIRVSENPYSRIFYAVWVQPIRWIFNEV